MSQRDLDTTMRDTGTFSRAVIHASGVETHYVRAGSGTVVVLLATDLERDAVRDTIRTLSRNFLVLAASPAVREPAQFSRWLHDFLEGLGAADAHVFLHEPTNTILTGYEIHE